MDPFEQQVHEFNDVVQIPLQPLMDNLPSSTYDVFEKDRVKYELVVFFLIFEWLIDNYV